MCIKRDGGISGWAGALTQCPPAHHACRTLFHTLLHNDSFAKVLQDEVLSMPMLTWVFRIYNTMLLNTEWAFGCRAGVLHLRNTDKAS